MKTLVLYDSNYGNTKTIADAIASELEPGTSATAIDGISLEILRGVRLLIVGSPVNAWKPTPKMNAFLARIQPGQLNGVKVATFDTRVRLFIHGNAAKLMMDALRAAGATQVSRPEGFIVKGKEGPLANGELERARVWATSLLL